MTAGRDRMCSALAQRRKPTSSPNTGWVTTTTRAMRAAAVPSLVHSMTLPSRSHTPSLVQSPGWLPTAAGP